MKYNETIVVDAIKNDTIYTYLKRTGFSENYLKNLRKKEGYILLNGIVAYTNDRVKDKDTISTMQNPNTITSIMHCVIPLDVVYEDDDLLVVNKPSGLSTSASRSHYTENLTGAILNYMKEKDNNFVVRIINRLDKDTSGLIIVAKHSLCAKKLNEEVKIQKTYYAIATGKIDSKLTVNKNIATTINDLGYNNHKREISENGKPAITHIEPVLFDGTNTLIRAQIEYGRTHQIRVHLSSIDHALLGDELYGQKSSLINHTALTCKQVSFLHPFKNKKIELEIPLDLDIENAINCKKEK